MRRGWSSVRSEKLRWKRPTRWRTWHATLQSRTSAETFQSRCEPLPKGCFGQRLFSVVAIQRSEMGEAGGSAAPGVDSRLYLIWVIFDDFNRDCRRADVRF